MVRHRGPGFGIEHVGTEEYMGRDGERKEKRGNNGIIISKTVEKSVVLSPEKGGGGVG